MKIFAKIILIITGVYAVSSCSKERLSDKAGLKMQEFVESISQYAKKYNSSFIIIPQNGPELAFKNLSPDEGIDNSYINAIDGFGIEELFYNGTYSPDNERLSMLRTLSAYKPVFVSEYVKDTAQISQAFYKNESNGFVCFVRSNENYYYTTIPDSVHNMNLNPVYSLKDVKNYLYLISYDNFSGKTQLIDTLKKYDFDLILMDLFFGETPFTYAEINELKHKTNGARRLVISYINIGAAENYRYYWKEDWRLHHPSWLKKPYEGYEDEIWVKFWKKDWQEIIYGNDDSYMKKIIDAGFDGAYLDNVEAYYFLYFD